MVFLDFSFLSCYYTLEREKKMNGKGIISTIAVGWIGYQCLFLLSIGALIAIPTECSKYVGSKVGLYEYPIDKSAIKPLPAIVTTPEAEQRNLCKNKKWELMSVLNNRTIRINLTKLYNYGRTYYIKLDLQDKYNINTYETIFNTPPSKEIDARNNKYIDVKIIDFKVTKGTIYPTNEYQIQLVLFNDFDKENSIYCFYQEEMDVSFSELIKPKDH